GGITQGKGVALQGRGGVGPEVAQLGLEGCAEVGIEVAEVVGHGFSLNPAGYSNSCKVTPSGIFLATVTL
ncbi:MAG: hypothetical protein WBM35_14400, partial [Candidatus Electrothrix sp.]